VVYSLAIIVWVNNFQTPKIQAVLSSFFRDGNDIAGGSNRDGGWGEEGGLNIGVQNGLRRQLKARGPVWTFLVLTALQIEDNRRWPAFRGLPSPPSTNTREP